ncbi:MAG: DUF2341 domain-containing protein [Candidatus Pacebacteria bacterium]|nr:DUF2341 domain-containing protein [Candidatus Paceibacterota bacterium]
MSFKIKAIIISGLLILIGFFSLSSFVFAREKIKSEHWQIENPEVKILGTETDKYSIYGITENEFLKEYPFLNNGFKNVNFEIQSNEPILIEEDIRNALIKENPRKGIVGLLLGPEIQLPTQEEVEAELKIKKHNFSDLKVNKEINKRKDLESKIEFSNLKIISNYSQQPGEGIKQKITIYNKADEDKEITFVQKVIIPVDSISCNGKVYKITEETLDLNSLSINCSNIVFTDSQYFYSRSRYDWQDIKSLNPEVLIYEYNGTYILETSVVISIDKNSSYIIDPSWYSSSWAYRKSITATSSATAIPSTQTDFPILISLSSDSDLASHAQPDGDDILFTSSNGTTKIDHEIEYYASSTGQLISWVEVPSLATSTVIYMYYGNASVSSQQNATGTWNSDYSAVYHMNQSSGNILDSKNQYNGTVSGTLPNLITGKVGYGQDFNGSSDYFKNTSLALSSPYSFEWWLTPDSISSTYRVIFAHKNTLTSGNDAITVGYAGNINVGNISYQRGLSGTSNYLSPGTTNYWTAIVNAYNNMSLYLDGNQKTLVTGLSYYRNQNANLIFGCRYDSGYKSYVDGKIDEVRISSVARSADWIKTTYYSINSPSTFYTLGSQVGYNAVPSFSAGPSDGGSSGTSPTNAGSNVSFSGTATDTESNNWKLLVCSTSTAPTASTSTPTCAGGDGNKWCVSSSWASSTVENNCIYTTTVANSESNVWYSFACDDSSIDPQCSSASQGTGDSGSPFKVNHSPVSSYYIDDGFYTYRKKLTINYTADGAQTNYQMKLLLGESSGASGEDVDCGSHIQTDFDDLRFTTSDEVTLIDYWIESITGTTPNQLATIWIEIPSIAADPDNTDIYMYYGNDDASSASNGTNTFVAIDSFDTDAWTDGGANVYVDTGNSRFYIYSDRSIDNTYSYKSTTVDDGNFEMRFKVYTDDEDGNGAYYIGLSNVAGMKASSTGGIFIAHYGGSSTVCSNDRGFKLDVTGSGLTDPDYYCNYSLDTWYTVYLRRYEDTAYIDIWDNNESTNYYSTSTDITGIGGFDYFVVSGYYTDSPIGHYAYAFMDTLRVRNFTTNEPTWASFGSEDTSSYFPSSDPTSLEAGNTITFGMGAHDDDTDTATDTVALLVCKTSGVSGTACDGGASDTWCGLSSATSSNPTCTSTASGLGSQTYYAYVFDNHSLGADINGASSTFTISNSVPSVGSITPGSVSLIESSTTTATSTCTVSDNNGCEDISSVVAVFYDDNAVDADCAADENNCYTGIACATSTCEGNNSDVLCTTYPYYYANASDWRWYVKVIDASSASSTNTSATTTIDNLIALEVSETDIDYGSIELSATSNQATTTIENTGNTNLDVGLYGTAMSCSLGTIAVGQQKFNTGGGETALTGVSQPVDLNVAQRTTTVPTGSIYWKLYAPSDGIAGTCSGTNTFEAANGG